MLSRVASIQSPPLVHRFRQELAFYDPEGISLASWDFAIVRVARRMLVGLSPPHFLSHLRIIPLSC